MFNWLLKLIAWLANLWSGLPDSTKERIINVVVEGFEEIFRQFYRSKQKEEATHG